MKTIFKSTILLAVVGLSLFTSCKDDNDSNPVLGQPNTFVLNAPAYSTVPVDLASSTEIPFTWSSPDYGFPVEAEFQLEASIDGNFTVSVEQADADETVKSCVADDEDGAQRTDNGAARKGDEQFAPVDVFHEHRADESAEKEENHRSNIEFLCRCLVDAQCVCVVYDECPHHDLRCHVEHLREHSFTV